MPSIYLKGGPVTDFSRRKIEEPISVIFGTPEQGWLPVNINSSKYKLNIDVSDVPVNPIEILCDVLLDVDTKKGEVWWNLEPEAVFFEFEKLAENYQLTIASAGSEESPRIVEMIIEGTFQDVVEPFITALVLFHSKPYDEKQWPSVDIRKINRLQLFKTRK